MTARAESGVGTKTTSLVPGSVIATPRLHARRKWIVRASLSLSISALVLVFLVIVRRDKMTIDECMRSMARPVGTLQAQVDSLGRLPASIPESSKTLGLRYADDLVRHYAQQAGEPVIIASSPAIPLILRDNGRGVILIQDGRVWQEWWTASEFSKQERAQEARLRSWDRQRRALLPQLP